MRLLNALTGAALLCTTATAAQVGDEVALSGTILCDTVEQVTDIVTAQQESWDAGAVVYRKYKVTRNHIGESKCGFMGDPFDVVLGESGPEFVDVYFPAGPQSVWIVEVKYMHPSGIWMDGAVVLGEPTQVGEPV